jgi:predicted transcriptional regulator
MKDSHLTLRLPAAVARVLERMARARAVPKSELVREALARYVSSGQSSSEAVRKVTAAELAARWSSLPGMTSDEARAMAADIEMARKELAPPVDPWA